MLRLRSYVLTHLISYPSASTISSHHGLLSTRGASACAPDVGKPHLRVEDYLVATCGLTRCQAFKASTKLSHLKSPSKPDAVLSYLAGLGLTRADVAAVVAKDPRFLCAKTEQTLASGVAGLTALGLSRSEIARLVSLAPLGFRCRSIVSKVHYYLLLLGSVENLLLLLRRNPYLISADIERKVKPTVAILRECGLSVSDIAKLCIRVPRILSTKLEHVQAMVACAEGIGVPRDSGMFRAALHAVAFLTEEKITAKVEHLKNVFRWSDAEVAIAVCKTPTVLTGSKDKMQRLSEFFISEVGLEPAYIAHRPAMLTYSLEGRTRPRYYVLKFLKENGLVHRDRDYYDAVMATEKVFVQKHICPHSESAPRLAEDYAAACRGEVPTSFRFT